jgi:hypothetical protein
MKVTIGDLDVECGESRMAGRQVASIEAWGPDRNDREVPREDEVWLVVNEYHGDHDTDWIIHLRDGFEIARTRLESVCRIVWRYPIA